MKVYKIGAKQYRLPNQLSDFQLALYIHLIDWKWANLTEEAGMERGKFYDAVLPVEMKKQRHPVYQPVVPHLLEHKKRFPFKDHKFIGHMASSQAACINLFLPLMEHPQLAAQILRAARPDLESIATDHLDGGFRIEFWDEPDNMLGDHNDSTGTDADFAIAYHDQQGDLCLWLIEHKLSETEFTTCGGYKSKGRTEVHHCRPASAVLDNPGLCYYHSKCGYRYWEVTLKTPGLFDLEQIRKTDDCSFMGGMNQLWRNQLLATSIEKSNSPSWPYKKVFFSVVHHPKNNSLQPSMLAFQALLNDPGKFSTFTSDVLIERARKIDVPELRPWLDWYQELYYF
jgi:hypothetical protein